MLIYSSEKEYTRSIRKRSKKIITFIREPVVKEVKRCMQAWSYDQVMSEAFVEYI